MHAHGWHGESSRRCAPRVPGAAAAGRPGSGTAWRAGVMSNGVVVRDRGTAILAIGTRKCMPVERRPDAGAGLAGIARRPRTNVALYLNRPNNRTEFSRARRCAHRATQVFV
ncbi:hypothetical protein BDAG_03817 [Burkholderia dolosa AU0158]|nr:hypothetical protein BDAG_03817 [Burkholderia dolosa AU0158]